MKIQKLKFFSKKKLSRGSHLRRLARYDNNIIIDKRNLLNIATLLMLIYFIFHSIYGSRGIIAYFQLKNELQKSHLQLDELKAHRLENENRTKLLRPESLDRDMLDQQIRKVLGFSKQNEKIFKKK